MTCLIPSMLILSRDQYLQERHWQTAPTWPLSVIYITFHDNKRLEIQEHINIHTQRLIFEQRNWGKCIFWPKFSYFHPIFSTYIKTQFWNSYKHCIENVRIRSQSTPVLKKFLLFARNWIWPRPFLDIFYPVKINLLCFI